jgi:hypothetical protein
MNQTDAQQSVNRYADFLADELRPVLRIDAVTENTDLLGAFVESVVRRLIGRVVQPLRVCRGGILDYPEQKIAQQDVIIWAPFPAPAIFDVDGFGLVPRSSAFAVLEIKKTDYSGVDTQLEHFTDEVEQHRAAAAGQQRPGDYPTRALGIISALTCDPSKRLAGLFESRRAVAIFDLRNGKKDVDRRGVVVLVNFLYEAIWRYWRAQDTTGPIQLLVED